VFYGASVATINAESGTVDITLPCITNVLNALASTWNSTGSEFRYLLRRQDRGCGRDYQEEDSHVPAVEPIRQTCQRL
jgi:hypothetical protein